MESDNNRRTTEKRKGGMNRIDRILENTARGAGLGGMVRMWRIIDVWTEVVGEPLAMKTEPMRISDNVLLVKVADSSWAHELTYLKDEMLERLKDRVDGQPIKDIRFFTGALDLPENLREGLTDLSCVHVDDREIAASVNEEALEGKPELRKQFVKMITNTYRIRNYLNERRSRSS